MSDVDHFTHTIIDECYFLKLSRLNRMLTAVYDHALKAHGITASQLVILVAIHRFGSPTPQQLCLRLNLAKSTLSRNLRLLKSNDWVLVQRNKRQTWLLLTPTGINLIKEIYPNWQKAQMDIQTLFGSQGTNAIVELAQMI